MLLFAGNFASSRRAALEGLGVADLALLRYGVAGTLALPFALRLGRAGLSWRRVAALTALGGFPYLLLTAWGTALAPATHAAVLNPGAVVLCGPLLGWLVLGERPPGGVLLAVPVVLVGLALVSGGAGPEAGPQVLAGDAVLALSGLTWALYGVLLRRWGVGGLRGAALVTSASLAWVPFHLALLPLDAIAANPREAALQAAYQGVCVGALGVALYSHAVATLGPARGALFPPMVPVLGTLAAAAVLGETVGPWQGAGMALAVAGMLLGALWRPTVAVPDALGDAPGAGAARGEERRR